MSARYSNSPTLHLRIADSPTARCLRGGFALVLGLAAVEIARAGYPLYALLAAPPVLWLQRICTRPLPAGSALSWCAGRWQLHRAGEVRELTLLRGHCLPLVTFVAWREAGGVRGRAWLFADSAPREQLRRLRVRLVLEGIV